MKFHQRFNIEVGLEEAKRRFVNRVHNHIVDEFESPTERNNTMKKIILDGPGDRIPPEPGWSLSAELGLDFYRNLQALEYLYHAPGSERRWFDELIPRLLNESAVDLEIRWESGQFIRSGAAWLDGTLVNDVLHWLPPPQFDTVRQPFEKGLTHFLHASQRSELLADVITDMYEALEALAKIIAKRPDKDLSGNRELFLSRVKASPEYKQLLKDYINYANKFRHATKEGTAKPALSPKEVESFMYLTGVFIRLAMSPEDPA